jgi:hypothetical protein
MITTTTGYVISVLVERYLQACTSLWRDINRNGRC